MSILHQEGSFFYCPFFTDLFIIATGFVFTVDADKYLYNMYIKYNKTYYKDSRFAD